jgi:hypothetical protein
MKREQYYVHYVHSSCLDSFRGTRGLNFEAWQEEAVHFLHLATFAAVDDLSKAIKYLSY